MYCLEVFVKYHMKIRMNKSQKLIQLINIFNLFIIIIFILIYFYAKTRSFTIFVDAFVVRF